MKTFTIKVAIRGVSPIVWSRFRIAADTSLTVLHYIIQIAQDWNDVYLHQFHIYGKDYGMACTGGTGFPDNPCQVVFDGFGFGFDVGDRFTSDQIGSLPRLQRSIKVYLFKESRISQKISINHPNFSFIEYSVKFFNI